MKISPPPGLHSRRNTKEKERKEKRRLAREAEDLLDPAGQVGREEARVEKGLQDQMLSNARKLLL